MGSPIITSDPRGPRQNPPTLRRRTLLALLGAGAAGVAVGASAGPAVESAGSTVDRNRTVDFYGQHQAGISTAGPQRVELAAFDLGQQAGLEQVRALMKRWTP